MLPELEDEVHTKEAKVRVTHASYPGIYAESQSFTVRYGAPVITDLQNNAGTIVRVKIHYMIFNGRLI